MKSALSLQPTNTPRVIQYHDDYDPQYQQFKERIRRTFRENMVTYGPALFTTDAHDLFKHYLIHIPPENRQHYTCRTCQDFIDTYGKLAFITDKGEIIPALWDKDRDSYFYTVVKRANITGVFISSEKTYGTPKTGLWDHFYVTPSSKMIFKSMIKTPEQEVAEKAEDFRMLNSALMEYNIYNITSAASLLEANVLYRAEKILGIAQWFKSLKEQVISVKAISNRINLVWKAAATAPAGFCHIRSSMIGTLLNDLKEGKALSIAARNFADKMNPTKYQRPQAPPKEGNIVQAEKLFLQLEASRALERRFATLNDLNLIWKSSLIPQVSTYKNGTFSILQPTTSRKKSTQVSDKVITITWTKFYKEVLLRAKEIKFYTDNVRNSFVGLTTAVLKTAPPIIQWDTKENRNPVSWYMYAEGSFPGTWDLPAYKYHTIKGICLQPSMWYEDFPQFGKGVIFIIEGAKPTEAPGLGLFPEILKSGFHGIRSTIEAYNAKKTPKPIPVPACGIMFSANLTTGWHNRFKVTMPGGIELIYHIDRWD